MAQNSFTWFKTAQDCTFRPCLANPITGTTWPRSHDDVMHHGAPVQKGPVWYKANQLLPLAVWL